MRYRARVPFAGALKSRFHNDHLAFRTLAYGEHGLHSVARIFERMGYEAAGLYRFPDKHLGSIHYRHPNASFPKIFISELKTWELSKKSRAIIARILGSHRKTPDLSTAGKANSYLKRLPWSIPQRKDVLALNRESQFAAWVVVHGYDVNHFTIRSPDIERTVAAFRRAGVPMKGSIEGRRGSKLRQSATVAVTENVPVMEGRRRTTMPWPYAYLEIAQRRKGFEGFLGPQATHLFEMTRKLSLLVLLAFSGCTVAQKQSADSRCGRGPGFDYCVQKGSDTVLYYLHGAGQSHRSWSKWSVARNLEKEFAKNGVPVPTVVSVSFGQYWILKNGDRLERFTDIAMPYIEKRIGVPKRRWLWGLSMGGFNAAQLLLRYPKMWSTVVLSCPAITPLSPYAEAEEIQEYIARNEADPRKVRWMLSFSRKAFGEREWPEHDPLALASNAPALPPVFIECGDKDEYGFYEGARSFADAVGADFHPVAGGGHCVVTHAIAEHLMRASRFKS